MDFEEAVSFAEKQLAGMETWTEAHKFSRHVADGAEFGLEFDDVEEWIELSVESRVVFDAVLIRCTALLRSGTDISPPLRTWIADVLSGAVQPPPTPDSDLRGSAADLAQRNLRLYYVVRRLVNHGLRATRNDSSPAVSACDAVADAMRRLKKLPSSYGTIKTIYAQVNRRQLFRPQPGADPDPDVSNFPEDLLFVGEIDDH